MCALFNVSSVKPRAHCLAFYNMNNKPNYKLKAELLNSQMLKDYKEYSRIACADYEYITNGVVYNNVDYGETYTDFRNNYKKLFEMAYYYTQNEKVKWKECSRIVNAQKHRVKRLKDKITKILTSGDCIFLTFTFSDEALERTSAETRKDKVKRFLTALECPYVANIDFGKKNHREHYHAVVGTSFVNYTEWRYGGLNGLKIRNKSKDIVRISKYIAKLTNHAIKETTKRSVIMYSRKY